MAMMNLNDPRIQAMLESDKQEALARIRAKKDRVVYLQNIHPPYMEKHFWGASNEWHNCQKNLDLALTENDWEAEKWL